MRSVCGGLQGAWRVGQEINSGGIQLTEIHIFLCVLHKVYIIQGSLTVIFQHYFQFLLHSHSVHASFSPRLPEFFLSIPE